MDIPLLGATLLVGLSWGAQFWGSKPEARAAVAPCVCHCECASPPESSIGIKLWIAVILLVGSWICFFAVWLVASQRERNSSPIAKGKGKRGVLGGSLALTLQ